MRKIYITCITALFFACTCMADNVVTFEEFEVNTDGYQNDFGEDGYFESGGFTFYCNYFPEWSYWSGFAVSNRTETSFASLTPDQFNCCVGHGANGSEKYCVAYPQGELIEVDAVGGQEISGMYVTNEAWVVDAILNGDGMTPGAFTTGDYLILKIIGNHADDTSDIIEFYLADYRSENEADHYYVNDWQWVDLSALGKVESLTFRMESSRNNDWGMTTPGYFCIDDFNGIAPSAENSVATFEEIALEADSYYNGAGVEGESIIDGWGSQVTKSYFTSGDYRFTTIYNPSYGSWSGFSVSNTTSSTYSDWSTDQYNNCIGHGYGGTGNFAVVYPSTLGETVEPISGPKVVSGMYVTNSAWNVYAYTVSDGMTPGSFTTGDWCKLTITGTHADGTTATVDTYLADYRSTNEADHYYLNDWQWVDLTPLGEVTQITFTISSSRNNDWGMTTPGYFCMDNLGGEPDGTTNIQRTSSTATSVEVARYTIDGKAISAPQRGINIVRMSDGTIFKEVVR
ncbi:MAG: DUF4465 domain-containing protein [Prevotella sp.]|nr:DUF4465 domain-containing protein [Prevotella sp.]